MEKYTYNKINAYETFDGHIITSEKDALIHCLQEELRSLIEDNIKIADTSVDEIVNVIMNVPRIKEILDEIEDNK